MRSSSLAGECATEQDEFWPFYDAMFSGRIPFGHGYEEAAQVIGLDEERFQTCYRNADHAKRSRSISRRREFYIRDPTFTLTASG